MSKDFRIIVDLSSAFNDARQYTYVFIDLTKIKTILDLKAHMIKLFSLKHPFHLLSTGKTYLPPDEDVRILEKNDLVIVVPGTGFSTEENNVSSLSIKQNGSTTSEKPRVFFKIGDIANDSLKLKNGQSNHLENEEQARNSSIAASEVNATLYHTVIEDFTSIDNSDSKMTDSNTTHEDGTNGTLDNGTDEQKVPRSRKRVRRKKSKNEPQLPDKDAQPTVDKKPKIVDNVMIPTGKHIRFNTLDDEKVSSEILDSSAAQPETVGKNMPVKSLHALLALRQTSTPKTFSMRKNQQENNNSSQDKQDASTKEPKKLDFVEQSEPEKNATQPKIGDVIQFKMLKIGADYSPVISDAITAEVVNRSNDMYGLKITSGKEEIEVPAGKFTLPEDETTADDKCDLTFLNHSMFLELQFLKHAT